MTPHIFTILPHVGAPPVLLGMSIDDVQSIMGESGANPRVSYYLHNALVINFDDKQQATYIHLTCTDQVSASYKQLKISGIPADELVSILKQEDASPVVSEGGCSVDFLDLDLGLWRPDVKDRFWLCIGVGRKGYLRELKEGLQQRVDQAVAKSVAEYPGDERLVADMEKRLRELQRG